MKKIKPPPVSFENIEVSRKKTYYSQWHILVNSNVNTKDPLIIDELSSCLKTGFEKAFTERAEDIFIIQGGGWDSDTVDDMKIQYATEIGDNENRVHLHGLVQVNHHANVRIDGKMIQVILREYCMTSDQIKNIFVRVKWVPTSRPLEDYIGKNPLTRKVEK